VTPNFGELLPESEDGGTLMQIGFIPNTYGKVFESELIITVGFPNFCIILRNNRRKIIFPE
jgi:hypothetical protein